MSLVSNVAGYNGDPQNGTPENIVGIEWEHKEPGRYIPVIFLLYA